MVSRVDFLETTPVRMDEVARVVRAIVYPEVSEEPEYVGYVVLGDREEGTGGTMRAVERYDVLLFDAAP
jgi:hypothetical protein